VAAAGAQMDRLLAGPARQILVGGQAEIAVAINSVIRGQIVIKIQHPPVGTNN